jgi:hypothetical protein
MYHIVVFSLGDFSFHVDVDRYGVFFQVSFDVAVAELYQCAYSEHA